jgi:hypothetical protein
MLVKVILLFVKFLNKCFSVFRFSKTKKRKLKKGANDDIYPMF